MTVWRLLWQHLQRWVPAKGESFFSISGSVVVSFEGIIMVHSLWSSLGRKTKSLYSMRLEFVFCEVGIICIPWSCCLYIFILAWQEKRCWIQRAAWCLSLLLLAQEHGQSHFQYGTIFLLLWSTAKWKEQPQALGLLLHSSGMNPTFCIIFASTFYWGMHQNSSPSLQKKQTKNPTHKHSCVGVTPFFGTKSVSWNDFQPTPATTILFIAS